MGKVGELMKYVGATVAAAVFPPSASIMLYIATRSCRPHSTRRRERGIDLDSLVRSVLDIRPAKLKVAGRLGGARVYKAGDGVYVIHSGYTLSGVVAFRARLRDGQSISEVATALSALPDVTVSLDPHKKTLWVKVRASRHALRPSMGVVSQLLRDLELRAAQTLSALKMSGATVLESGALNNPLEVFSA